MGGQIRLEGGLNGRIPFHICKFFSRGHYNIHTFLIVVRGGHAFSARAIVLPPWWPLRQTSQAKLTPKVLSARYLRARIYILYLNGIIKITLRKGEFQMFAVCYLLCFRFSCMFFLLFIFLLYEKQKALKVNGPTDVLMCFCLMFLF